jgi:hypothetical protein
VTKEEAVTDEATGQRYKTGQGKPELRMEFAKYLTDPNRVGTQEEWARKHGVAASTLSDWKRHPEVRGLLSQWRETYKPDFAQVVDAMFQKAKAGDVQAARLLGDWLGENAPTKIDQTTRTTLADYLAGRLSDRAAAERSS